MISAAVMCLAMNLYHETRGETLAGNIAVGYVTMNRVADPRYPDTVCGVVHQAKYHGWDLVNPIKNRCQFSWYCDGLSDNPQDGKAMLESVLIAQHIIAGTVTDISEGATHYHATYVNPYWSGDMTVVLEVGQHIFYK
jgi:spore germination cell wall hydrolase CwlJ-like protein|tara:strand:+ start:203 stop:616 length:414 start_codon:yes stop_codon:yes gene_type:complete